MSNLEEKFLAYIDNELTEEERVAFEKKLDSNKQLQKDLAAFKQAQALLKDYAKTSYEADNSLKSSILAEIKNPAKSESRFSVVSMLSNILSVVLNILNPKFARYAICGIALIVTGITTMTFLGQEVSETFSTVGYSIDSTSDNPMIASAPSSPRNEASKPQRQSRRGLERRDRFFKQKSKKRDNVRPSAESVAGMGASVFAKGNISSDKDQDYLADSMYAPPSLASEAKNSTLEFHAEEVEVDQRINTLLQPEIAGSGMNSRSINSNILALKESKPVATDSIRELKDFSVLTPDANREKLGQYSRTLGKKAPRKETSLPLLHNNLVDLFLEEREKVKGIKFMNPVGYWRSTYLPGDRAFRSLSMQLKNQNYENLARRIGLSKLILDKQAKPPKRYFDSPDKGALSLYLNTDRKEVSGESRVLLQVGLQGATRSSSTRPETTTALVIDTSNHLNRNQQKKIIALIEAFLAEKQVGDRFSLYTSEGQALSFDKFSYGQIAVLKPTLFDSKKNIGDSVLSQASEYIKSLEGENDLLGSSNIVYITSGQLPPEAPIEAHKSAISGIPVSIVSLSGPSHEIDRFALSGQGNRWFINSVSDAKRIANSELFAANRTVARALRINIKLKEGVKLVKVIGSEKLNLKQISRVKEAEKSIDQRMAKDFSILADRGEDDDGVQLVIPSFYAGDSHSLLLDLVVPGAGEIADVEMKYKDMVKLKNGSIQAAHSLASGDAERGTMEYSVLSNFLAYELAKSLENAAKMLEQGQSQEALRVIKERLKLLEGLLVRFPKLGEDEAFNGDLAMLREYKRVFAGNWGPHSDELLDSLRLAAWKKILSEPKAF